MLNKSPTPSWTEEGKQLLAKLKGVSGHFQIFEYCHAIVVSSDLLAIKVARKVWKVS
jgi:hypothetical protein